MDLEELAAQLAEYTATLVEAAEQQRSVAVMRELVNRLCGHYRSLGILMLLNTGDSDPFFHGLIQSAVARRWYLDRCRAEGCLAEPARRASFVDPFLDAVAANQLPLARDIAGRSPDEWMEGHEYEDDFAYARALFDLVAPAGEDRTAALEATLSRFAQSLEGGSDPRLDVCRALAARDQALFDDAFATLGAERERRLAEVADPKRDSILAQDYDFEPNRRIWVEGLALLRLAVERGLRTASEYAGCPAIARRYDYSPFKPIAFPLVPL